MASLLRVENIDKHYGGVHALRNVSVSFESGEVHALMGENGAGKSTLGKVIAGAVRADQGQIFLDGRRVTIDNPLDAQRLGISIIFQELDLFPNLSVAENMVIGNLNYPDKLLVNPRSMERFCRPFLEQVGLNVSGKQSLGALPIGKMQQVAIARALSMNVRLIVMDESTSSLTEDAVEHLFSLIKKLRDSGVTIAYVSHKLEEVFRICDRVSVLRDGQYVATHRIADVDRRKLIRLMVGRDIGETVRGRRDDRGNRDDQPLLSVSKVTTSKLKQISFDLHGGEVVGIAGLVGAGRSELGAALFGLDRVVEGNIRLRGKPYQPKNPRTAIKNGLGLLPEDRKREGLMMQLPVNDNATISIIAKLAKCSILRGGKEREVTQSIYEQTSLKAASPLVPVNTLSGGNQQKVLLARWLLVDPDVIFLDDPTRGVDVGAKEDIYSMIDRLALDGKGVLLVSSELPELLRCCDRIMVLQDGQLTGTVSADECTQEQILELATHGDRATDS